MNLQSFLLRQENTIPELWKRYTQARKPWFDCLIDSFFVVVLFLSLFFSLPEATLIRRNGTKRNGKDAPERWQTVNGIFKYPWVAKSSVFGGQLILNRYAHQSTHLFWARVDVLSKSPCFWSTVAIFRSYKMMFTSSNLGAWARW